MDAFPVPTPTLSFLGGPMDGFKAEPDVEPSLDVPFPEVIFPDDGTGHYHYLPPGVMPAWVVVPLHSDTFDAVYVWCDYLEDIGPGDTSADLTPVPELLS